MNDVRKL